MIINSEQTQKLLGTSLFADCKADDIDTFIKSLEIVCFSQNERIFTPYNFKRSLAIILNGDVTVKNTAGVLLNTLSSGDCFGAAGLFQNNDDYVSILTASSSGELVFITKEMLTLLFSIEPQIAINYISFLSGRIDFLTRKIQRFTAPSAEIKLAIEILGTAQNDIREIPNGYAELAKSLNMGRASLYRALDLLEEKNTIEKNIKQIIIKDRTKLEVLVHTSMI